MRRGALRLGQAIRPAQQTAVNAVTFILVMTEVL
jgi:hypothetical protein